jgi:hypothetical protein
MTSPAMNTNNAVPYLERLRVLLKSNKDVNEHQIEQYEKFLFLIKKHSGLKAVPTKQIDMVWHYHLEFTDLYATDCKNIFGRTIIHKQPATDKEFKDLEDKFKLTNRLWFLNYNEQMGSEKDMAICGVDGDGGDNGNDDY